jgi:hypothetical protein
MNLLGRSFTKNRNTERPRVRFPPSPNSLHEETEYGSPSWLNRSIKYVYSHNNYVDYMPNITLVVSEELRRDMEKHPSIKWSSAVRNIIEQKLADFKELEKLAEKEQVYHKGLEAHRKEGIEEHGKNTQRRFSMRVTVDANILFACLIKDSTTRRLVLNLHLHFLPQNFSRMNWQPTS